MQRNCVLLVYLDKPHQCRRIKLCLKCEIWPLHLDMFPCNPKTGVCFHHLVMWGNLLLLLCLIGLITWCILPLYNIINFPIMHSISFTCSVGSSGDISSGFFFRTSASYVCSCTGYGWCYGFFYVLWPNWCKSSFTYADIDMSTYRLVSFHFIVIL